MVLLFALSTIFVAFQTKVLADCKDKPIDLIMAVANSGKFLKNETRQQKDFVFNLLDRLDISQNGTHLRIIPISKFQKFSNRFDGSVNLKDLKHLITKEIETKHDLYDAGSTLKLIAEEGFNTSQGGRDYAKKIVIVFTKGISINSSSTVYWAQKVKELSNITVFAIGDGMQAPGSQEMQRIATNKSFVFDDMDYGLKEYILQNVTNRICGPEKESPVGRCPRDWIFYNCSCYHLLKSIGRLSLARKACQAVNADLAVIDNECEFQFLEGNFPTSWIGIRKIINNTIYWIDNSIYVDKFNHYNRNDSLNQHCLHGFSYKPICHVANLPFLCERKITNCSIYPCPLNKAETSVKGKPLEVQGHQENTFQIKLNNKTFIERMNNLKQNLTVDKRALSSQQRKLKSYWDNRKSSAGIGVVGVLVIVTGPILIVLCDCVNYVSKKRGTKKNQWT